MSESSRSMEAMPQRSYSYARISRTSQTKGDGLRRQQGKLEDDDESWPERVSKEYGWILDDALRFTDKRSGFHQKNLAPTADLTRCLKLIESGRITPGSVLLIDKLDRLSRADVDKAYDLYRDIIRAGVWICTKTPARIYRPDAQSSFMDLLEPIWLMYLNWQESLKKQENAREAWATAIHKARKDGTPLPSRLPAWLGKSEQGEYVLLEDKKQVIRRLHELNWADMGSGMIAAQMIAEGVAPLRPCERWTMERVRQLLSERSLMGEYQPHEMINGRRTPIGEPIPQFFPAVLTEEEHLHSQNCIAARAGARGRPGLEVCNVLLGLAKDAVCRRNLVIRSRKSHGKKHSYLTVQPVGGFAARYDELEQLVVEIVSHLQVADVVDSPAEANDRQEEISRLTRRLEGLDLRHQQLLKAAADPEQDGAEILGILKTVKAEKLETAKQLQRLKLEQQSGRVEALGAVQSLCDLLLASEGEEKGEIRSRLRSALPTVVQEIWCQAQRLSLRTQIVHVQVFLHNGEVRYARLLPVNLKGVTPWDIEREGHDLRSGPYGESPA